MGGRKLNWFEKKLKVAEEMEAALRKRIRMLEEHIARQDKIIFDGKFGEKTG
jgi:hypothetical protein